MAEENQDLLQECLVNTIVSELGRARSMDYEGEVERIQCKQFVLDAVALAGNIRQSISHYKFENMLGSDLEHESVVLKMANFNRYTIIDSMTGARLRASAEPKADENGRIGEVLCIVYPAFVRKATLAAEKVVLVKPTIVVKFDQKIARRGRAQAAN